MSKLRAPLKDWLDADLPEAQVQRMWRTLNREPSRRWRWSLLGAGVAFGLSAALWWLVAWSGSPRAVEGPLVLAGGPLLGAAETFGGDEPLELALSDGSRVALAALTQLTVLENDGRVFALKLVQGRTLFDVEPGGPRRWRIECGPATIEVVGTRFAIERDARGVRVDVAHGVVRVRSLRLGEPARKLVAGESVYVSEEGERAASAAADAGSSPLSAAEARRPPRADEAMGGLDVRSHESQPKLAATGPTGASGTAEGRGGSSRARASSPAAAPPVDSHEAKPPLPAQGSVRAADTGVVSADTPSAAAEASASSRGAAPRVDTREATRTLGTRGTRRASGVSVMRAKMRGTASETSASTLELASQVELHSASRTDDMSLPETSQDTAAAPTAGAISGMSSSSDSTTRAQGRSHASPATLAQWLDAADAARRARDPQRAERLLARVMTAAPHSAHAAVAALTLARLQLERDPATAAAAVSSALAAALPTGLREDATALLVESHARAGQRELAVAAARAYLERYPEGQRAQAVRRWAGLP